MLRRAFLQVVAKNKILCATSKLALNYTNFGRFLSMIATIKLEKIVNKCHSIENYVNLAYSFQLGPISIRPAQVKEEIIQLLRFLAKLRPTTVCEIGTAGGGTLFLFAKVSHPNAIIISIDLPGGPFGGGYPEWKASLYKHFAYSKQRIHLIRGDSHDLTTYQRVKKILAGKKLDFLFIDGDHTYEGVKKDFETYSSLVRQGGIISFHDIVPGSPENVGGVPKFWNEIKHRYKYREIVKDWKQNGYGIGIIYV